MNTLASSRDGNRGSRKLRNLSAALLLFGFCAMGSTGCVYDEPYYGAAPVRSGYYAAYDSGYGSPYYDPYYYGGGYGPYYGASGISVGISRYGNSRYGNRRYYGRNTRYRGGYARNRYYRRNDSYTRSQAIRSDDSRVQRRPTRVRVDEDARGLADEQPE